MLNIYYDWKFKCLCQGAGIMEIKIHHQVLKVSDLSMHCNAHCNALQGMERFYFICCSFFFLYVRRLSLSIHIPN